MSKMVDRWKWKQKRLPHHCSELTSKAINGRAIGTLISTLVRRLRHSLRRVVIPIFGIPFVDELVPHVNLPTKLARSGFDVTMDDNAVVIIILTRTVAAGARVRPRILIALNMVL